MLIRLMMRLTGADDSSARKRRKTSRVEPTPEEVTSTAMEIKLPNLRTSEIPNPVQFCVPPSQRYLEHNIQPPADLPPMDFIQIARCPDVSIVSRQQKERVMNGGWTSGMNAPPRRKHHSAPAHSPVPSLPPISARSAKPSPTPSINSKTSTRSPSLPRSSASTGSKSPTTPSLDGH